jgi:hypothetical protein
MNLGGANRAQGLRRALVGLVLFVPGVVLFVFARAWLLRTFGTHVDDQVEVRIPSVIAVVIGGPMACGYCLFMAGLWSALFGQRGQSTSALWSIARVVFGVVATIGMVVVAIMVANAFRSET